MVNNMHINNYNSLRELTSPGFNPVLEPFSREFRINDIFYIFYTVIFSLF